MNFKKYIKENTGLVISDLFLKAVTKTGYIDELNDEELSQLIKDSYLVKEYFKWTLDVCVFYDDAEVMQKLAEIWKREKINEQQNIGLLQSEC